MAASLSRRCDHAILRASQSREIMAELLMERVLILQVIEYALIAYGPYGG